MFRYAEDLFRPGMENTVREIWSNDKHVAFGAACYRHGIMMSSQWNKIRVNGVSAQDQLLSWINDGVRTEVMSTCTGVNCQDTCPDVVIGDNALC